MTKRIAQTIAWLMLGATAPLHAQDQPTLDELLDLSPPKPAEEAAPSPEGPAKPQAAPQLDAAVEQLLDQKSANDAFEQAVREMDDVSLRLGRDFDPGLDTQRAQESILRKLDQVIATARQQQQQSSSSSSSSSNSGSQSSPQQQDTGGSQVAQQNPGDANSPSGQAQGENQQASQSANSDPNRVNQSGSPEGQAPDRPLEELRSEWGNLPPRLRDELTEGLSEQFNPVYRDLTEAYYRRLAEEEQ